MRWVELAPRHDRRLRAAIGLFVLSFVLVFQEGAITVSDGLATYQVAQSLVEHGSLAVDSEVGEPGRDGRYYSRYGVGLSVLAVVPYALAHPLASISGHKERVLQAAVASLMPVVAALAAVAVHDLSRRLGANPIDSALAGVGMILGTFFLPYARDFFSEPLAALLLVVTIERLLARSHVAAAVALGCAALVRPQLFLLAPPLMLLVGLRATLRATTGAAVALAAAAAISAAYNVARFSDPFQFGYAGQGFTTPFREGAVGLLLHPDKSVFLFAPVMLLSPLALYRLTRGQRLAGLMIVANLAVGFALTATWWAWEGGWSWGPRLLLPALLPVGAAIAVWTGGSNRGRQLVAALFACGFLLSAPTLLVSSRAQQLHEPTPAIGPGIPRQFELMPEVVKATVTDAGSYEAGAGQNYRFVNTWQVGVAREVGRAGAIAAALLTALLLAGVFLSGRMLWGQLRDERRLERTTARGLASRETAP